MDFIATARRTMLAGQMADARERLLTSIEGLSEEEMLEPGVCGEWSVRDVLAHIAAWDRETTAMFEAMLRGERHYFLDLDEEGLEQFNQDRHETARGLTVDEAVAELTASREALLDLVRETDNARMFAPAPGDEHADFSIAACLGAQISHDEEHAEMIEAWRGEAED
jgi:uncharacterized protein (TIGR03083 family)